MGKWWKWDEEKWLTNLLKSRIRRLLAGVDIFFLSYYILCLILLLYCWILFFLLAQIRFLRDWKCLMCSGTCFTTSSQLFLQLNFSLHLLQCNLPQKRQYHTKNYWKKNSKWIPYFDFLDFMQFCKAGSSYFLVAIFYSIFPQRFQIFFHYFM